VGERFADGTDARTVPELIVMWRAADLRARRSPENLSGP
jgi:hypothetical protein